MTEDRAGSAGVAEPGSPSGTDPDWDRRRAEAVARADLLRSRQAVLGSDRHPLATRFANDLARAVESGTTTGAAGPVDPATVPGLDSVPLPASPALLCDSAERVLRVNPALLRLLGREPGAADPGGGLVGQRLARFVVGPDADARAVRVDGGLVRVRVVRWTFPGRELHAVLLVELGESAGERADERRRIADLERLAQAGTWAYDLATGELTRSETLLELYRSAGVDVAAHPVERDQVGLLCQDLRRGGTGDEGPRHVEHRIGRYVLSCHAQVERAAEGEPVRLVGMVRDVTTQRMAEGRVRHSGQRFADLVSLVPTGVALFDPAGRLVDANAALCRLLDRPAPALRGTPAAALVVDPSLEPGGEGPPRWLRRVPPGAEHGYRVEMPLLRGDGTGIWCALQVSVSTSDDGGWFWLVVATELDRGATLPGGAPAPATRSVTDELTRLPNRAGAVRILQDMLAGPTAERVVVACCGLDDFQRVNSSLGHEAGDDLLVTLAGRLRRELPAGCAAARLTGDVFVVLCVDHTAIGGPGALAGRISELLRTTAELDGHPVRLTASVGVAPESAGTGPGAPPPARAPEAADLLRYAEVAMHEAKRRAGPGGVAVATAGVVAEASRQLRMEAELRAAIAEGGLELEFQPVVAPDGTVLTAEALVRWPHPQRGRLGPGEFLPVAERADLLRELDRWVLRAAVREAAGWPVHHGRRVAVAVNLAGLLPHQEGFAAEVGAALDEAGLPADQLVLELVETSLVALPPHALAAMAELVGHGVRFAVDDFGTGYSSLARLKHLPAQIVKIDRAFVSGVDTDQADFAVVRAVVDIAAAMGRRCVAEGVETREQFHVLRGLGVDAFQGWLFARGLPGSQMAGLLAGDPLRTPVAPSPRHGRHAAAD